MAAADGYRASFCSLLRLAVQASVFRRLLKKVQMQGGARSAD